MNATVDLVVAGDASPSRAAAIEALRRGQRVLIVLQSADARMARRLRRSLRIAGGGGGQLTVATAAEVVCVDGVDGVEAVVVRGRRTGRLWAVNAFRFVPCGG